jgi:hypothetical protein
MRRPAEPLGLRDATQAAPVLSHHEQADQVTPVRDRSVRFRPSSDAAVVADHGFRIAPRVGRLALQHRLSYALGGDGRPMPVALADQGGEPPVGLGADLEQDRILTRRPLRREPAGRGRGDHLAIEPSRSPDPLLPLTILLEGDGDGIPGHVRPPHLQPQQWRSQPPAPFHHPPAPQRPGARTTLGVVRPERTGHPVEPAADHSEREGQSNHRTASSPSPYRPSGNHD